MEEISTFSHLPVLKRVIEEHKPRTVFEFGMGDGSTPLFIEHCRQVVSVEMQSLSWYVELVGKYEADNWAPICLPCPRCGIYFLTGGQTFDLVFVDGHGDTRPEQIRAASEKTDLIIAHDTEEPSYGWGRVNMPGWKETTYKDHPTWTTVYERR
jgi:hypothetical protein